MADDAQILGAFCEGPPVRLMGEGGGPLAGLRFAAKDNFDVEGHVTGAGNPDWRCGHPPATKTATAISLLLAAGASLEGKTIMDELAFGALGQNRHYGTPLNSAAPGHIPGGSSSGSASAVAAEAVDFALGTDSACSVRLPASLCGLFGLRPSHGRVPMEGVVPLSPSLDTVGWLSREAHVLQRVGEVLLEPAEPAPPIRRLLFPRDVMRAVPEETLAALRPAIARVEERLGAHDEMDLGEPGTERAFEGFFLRSAILQVQEVWECHGRWIQTTRPDSVVLNEKNLAVGAGATEAQRSEARVGWDELRSWIRGRIQPGAALVLPTAIGGAPRVGLPTESYGSFTVPSLSLLSIAVLGGLPQISLPGATLQGLPLGLSLVGAPNSDEHLLDLGVALGALPAG